MVEEAFIDLGEPVVSADALVGGFAWYVAFTSTEMPYGTPASETPWFQMEGWPILLAIKRTTELAIHDALPCPERGNP